MPSVLYYLGYMMERESILPPHEPTTPQGRSLTIVKQHDLEEQHPSARIEAN